MPGNTLTSNTLVNTTRPEGIGSNLEERLAEFGVTDSGTFTNQTFDTEEVGEVGSDWSPDPATGLFKSITLTEALTIDPSNILNGQAVIVDIYTGAGSFGVTVTGASLFSGGYTATSTASRRDRIVISRAFDVVSVVVQGQGATS